MIQQPKPESQSGCIKNKVATQKEVLHSMTDINSPRRILIIKAHCHKNNGNLMNGLVLVLKVRSVKSLIWLFERLIGF